MPECPECHGDGVVPVGGVSFNPYVGMLTPDPQETHDEPCPTCEGEGEVSENPDYGFGNPDFDRDFERTREP